MRVQKPFAPEGFNYQDLALILIGHVELDKPSFFELRKTLAQPPIGGISSVDRR